MERRTFIKNTALCAVAVSASGFIRFDGFSYVGDCETTTDILGPFYRPDSPARNNLLIKGDPGTIIELSGMVKHKDCKTPHKKAKIELWHCSSKGVYDNTSNEFLYRGTTYSDDKGQYLFKTILPVPYDIGGGSFRPAHFHIMITAEGYQSLVTQLYFSGDTHLTEDSSSSSPTAKRRIMDVKSLKDGTKKVVFDVSMSDTLAAEPASIDRLTGIYSNNDDKSKLEFFKKNNALWIKNEVFGNRFEYIGNNTFQYPGTTPDMTWKLSFEMMTSGAVKLTQTSINQKGEKVIIAMKEK